MATKSRDGGDMTEEEMDEIQENSDELYYQKNKEIDRQVDQEREE